MYKVEKLANTCRFPLPIYHHDIVSQILLYICVRHLRGLASIILTLLHPVQILKIHYCISFVTHCYLPLKTESQKAAKRKGTHSPFTLPVFQGLEQGGIKSHSHA